MLAEAQGGQGWCFFDFDQAFRIIVIMLTVLCNVINDLAVLGSMFVSYRYLNSIISWYFLQHLASTG